MEIRRKDVTIPCKRTSTHAHSGWDGRWVWQRQWPSAMLTRNASTSSQWTRYKATLGRSDFSTFRFLDQHAPSTFPFFHALVFRLQFSVCEYNTVDMLSPSVAMTARHAVWRFTRMYPIHVQLMVYTTYSSLYSMSTIWSSSTVKQNVTNKKQYTKQTINDITRFCFERHTWSWASIMDRSYTMMITFGRGAIPSTLDMGRRRQLSVWYTIVSRPPSLPFPSPRVKADEVGARPGSPKGKVRESFPYHMAYVPYADFLFPITRKISQSHNIEYNVHTCNRIFRCSGELRSSTVLRSRMRCFLCWPSLSLHK